MNSAQHQHQLHDVAPRTVVRQGCTKPAGPNQDPRDVEENCRYGEADHVKLA